MTLRNTATALALTVSAAGAALTTASPAAAGGVGDLLSPAFGTSCANRHTGARADGATTHGTGAADGNSAGLPLGGAVNQCGGADAPLISPDAPRCAITQWFPGTNILTGHTSPETATEAPVDAIVQVLSGQTPSVCQ
ncbi:hypothetical protein AB0K93_09900 [Streptomyces sp. NPDC052676]|uniref:hypothetical protein n=1 Tax=Streptomyces sp. NPDC052676 TaxID=3154953 RepID=UPI00342B2EF3